MKIAYLVLAGVAVIVATIFTALGAPLIVGAGFLGIGIVVGFEARHA